MDRLSFRGWISFGVLAAGIAPGGVSCFAQTTPGAAQKQAASTAQNTSATQDSQTPDAPQPAGAAPSAAAAPAGPAGPAVQGASAPSGFSSADGRRDSARGSSDRPRARGMGGRSGGWSSAGGDRGSDVTPAGFGPDSGVTAESAVPGVPASMPEPADYSAGSFFGSSASGGRGMGAQGGGGMGRGRNGGGMFQMDGASSQGMSQDLGLSGTDAQAAKELMRGGVSLPMSSSIGNFRVAYQSPFSLTNGMVHEGGGFGSSSAMYDSPHARTGGIDFSASAKVGMGSMMGAGGGMSGMGGGHGGGIGMGGPGGRGGSADPSTSVTLHLSF